MLSEVSSGGDWTPRLGKSSRKLQRGVGLFQGLAGAAGEGEGGGGVAVAQLGQVECGQRGEGGGEGASSGGDRIVK